MPSVKAITAKSLGTFKPILLAVLMLSYRKSSFTAKTASMVLSCNNCPIIISQVSTSSILMIKFSLNGMSLSNKALYSRQSSIYHTHNQP
jgi:hypothetical protein